MLRSHLPNGNRSTTGNVTLLTRSDASHAATRGAQTSAAQGDQEGNVSDLKSLAINAANLIQFRSSHRLAGQSYAAIVLARVERNKGPEVIPVGVAKS